jgi:hypothetical protein
VEVWEFDVGVTTHDALKEGHTVLWWLNTRVLAENHMTASLVAAQMGACHGYVTECRYRE